MPAFFIATVKVKNPEKFQEYAKRAAATFAPYGGEVALRGKAEDALAGALGHDSAGVVKFPDMDMLLRWFKSREYQAIVPLRDEASDMTIIAYSAPS